MVGTVRVLALLLMLVSWGAGAATGTAAVVTGQLTTAPPPRIPASGRPVVW